MISVTPERAVGCFPDPFPRGGAQAGAAAHRVDGDVPVRLQGREDDALPQGHDAARGPGRRGQCPAPCGFTVVVFLMIGAVFSMFAT